MGFGASQSLSKDTPTNVGTNLTVYAVRFVDSDHSEYAVTGITPPAAKQFVVGHITGKGGEERHKAQLLRTEVDALLIPAQLQVTLTVVRPPSTALTNAIVKEEIYKLIDFLTEGGAGANIDAILNGEM
jgi:hypothetical protein